MCRRVAISFCVDCGTFFRFFCEKLLPLQMKLDGFSNEARWFSNEASQYGPIEKNDKNGKTGSYQGDSL